MKLYYSKGACSLVVRIIIHELGLKSEYEAVDLGTKKTATGEDYLKINPKGAVPAIITDAGETLTENSAIQQYLADNNHADELLPPIGNFRRYRVLEWLNYVATELHKSCSPLFNPNIPHDMKETIFLPTLNKKFDYIEQHLQHTKYLAGDTFTLPDAYIFIILSWQAHFKNDLSKWKHISEYFAQLQKRKSVQQALKEEGLI